MGLLAQLGLQESEEEKRAKQIDKVKGLLGTAPQPAVIGELGRFGVQLQELQPGSGLLGSAQTPEDQMKFMLEAQKAGMTQQGAQGLLDPIRQQGQQLRQGILDGMKVNKEMTEQSLKQGNVLRKERGEQLKPFVEAKTQYNTTMNALQQGNAAGTLAAIFSFMKTLDPRSVVREGEFEMATRTGGVVDSLVTMVNNAKGRGMGAMARKNIAETIQAIMEGRVADAESISERYDQIAQEQGVPMSQIRTGAYDPELQGVPTSFYDKDLGKEVSVDDLVEKYGSR